MMSTKKKIIIFGSTGFVGAYLTRYFQSLINYKVFPLVRESSLNKIKGINYFKNAIVGDVLDPEFISETINKIMPDVIIYCISQNHIQSQKDLSIAYITNVLPLVSVLAAAHKINKQIKFVYFSTLQVFGDYRNSSFIDENSKVSPMNHYALTHKSCDDLLDYYNLISKIDTTSVLLSNSFGYPLLNETDCWWLVINDFCKSAVKDNKIIIRSDGTPQRDFISLDAVCLKLEYIINVKSISRAIISSGKTFTIFELALLIKDRVERSLNCTVNIENSSGEPFVYNAEFEDISKTTIASKIQDINYPFNHSEFCNAIDSMIKLIKFNKGEML